MSRPWRLKRVREWRRYSEQLAIGNDVQIAIAINVSDAKGVGENARLGARYAWERAGGEGGARAAIVEEDAIGPRRTHKHVDKAIAIEVGHGGRDCIAATTRERYRRKAATAIVDEELGVVTVVSERRVERTVVIHIGEGKIPRVCGG